MTKALFAKQGAQERRNLVMPEPYRPRHSFDSFSQQLQAQTATIEKLEKKISELDEQIQKGGYITRAEFTVAMNGKVSREGEYFLVKGLVFGWVVTLLLAATGAILYSAGLVQP